MRAPTQRDEIGVIETAYRCDLDDAAWLRSVARVVAPLLDRGAGVATWLFDARDPSHVRVLCHEYCGSEDAHTALTTGQQGMDPTMLAQAYTYGLGTTLSSVVGADFLRTDPGGEMFRSMGLADVLGLVGADPTRQGIGIAIPLPAIETTPRPLVRRWSRLLAHLTAAHRVRRTLMASSGTEAEAVIEPDGRCAHAEPAAQSKAARQALREAAVAMDRARGRLREHDRDEAIADWRALVGGRWSLVEHFESDGRRFLLARRNDPETDRPATLTLRERQVLGYRALGHPLKLIAYELGVGISSVSGTLKSGMQKLGVSNAAELMRAFAPGAPRT